MANSPSQGGAWVFLPGLITEPIEICAFLGVDLHHQEDQLGRTNRASLGSTDWWYCPNSVHVTLFLSPFHLFSISFFLSLSLSHIYYQIKPILLSLAYVLVCTFIWAEAFLRTLVTGSWHMVWGRSISSGPLVTTGHSAEGIWPHLWHFTQHP